MKNTKIKHLKNNWQLYALLAPFLILFIIMNVLPVISSMVLSFFNYDMVSAPEFSGVGNYMRMFVQDDIFLTVLKNTIRLAVVVGPAGFLLSFVLAWMINEFRPAVRTLLSFMFYAPALIGNGLFIWQIMFNSDSYGYMNSLLLSIGVINSPIQWLSNETAIIPIVIIVQLWQSMGVSFLANISGLQNINPELFEAGSVDGIKNRWQELWYITLPGMKHMLLFSAVMQIQSAFSISSIITSLAGYPSVNNSVDTLVSYIGDIATSRYEMGYAAALSVFLFAIVLIFRYGIGAMLNLIGKSDS